MTFKEIKELRSMDDKALMKELVSAKHSYAVLKFENSQGNLKNTSLIPDTKSYIAHIQTAMSERKNTKETTA